MQYSATMKPGAPSLLLLNFGQQAANLKTAFQLESLDLRESKHASVLEQGSKSL